MNRIAIGQDGLKRRKMRLYCASRSPKKDLSADQYKIGEPLHWIRVDKVAQTRHVQALLTSLYSVDFNK